MNFLRQNLHAKRTKNYFSILIFAQKVPKIACFSVFLGVLAGFLFHMKHTPKLELFHVKHIILRHFHPLFTAYFRVFYHFVFDAVDL